MLGAIIALLGQTGVEFDTLAPQLVQQNLALVPTKAAERRPVLESMFKEAGCDGDRLTAQPIPHTKEDNVICRLSGQGSSDIVVGAHTDFIDHGIGAVDDWSGAALLPSLYRSLKSKPRKHDFVFVGFGGEERGLLGSRQYVKAAGKSAVRAMINLECVGMSPPKIWYTRADKNLRDAYARVAGALHIPAAGMNVDNVGDDDSHPFLDAKIPVLTIHSVTPETLSILHSSRDNLKAINPDDYYSTYRLTAAYLAYLDQALP
jgi:hypothetical protein